jgi:hypothetical protein
MKYLDPPKRSATELRKFGLTQDEFDELWHACLGRCPLCEKAFTRDRRRPAAIDHDHKTGAVRGLLCRQCNWLLGFLHENVAWMRRAVHWLENNTVSLLFGSARYVKDAPPRKEP